MSKDAEKNAWLKYDENGKEDVFNFCEGYKDYLSEGKTERECINEAIRLAEEKGYRNLNKIIKNNETLKAGDKVYFNNKDKSLALYLIGKDSFSSSPITTLILVPSFLTTTPCNARGNATSRYYRTKNV